MRRNFYIALALTAVVVIIYFGYTRFLQPRNIFSRQVVPTVYVSEPQSNTTNQSVQSYSTSTTYYDMKYSVPEDNQLVAKEIKQGADTWLKETNIQNVKNNTQAEQEFGIFEGVKYDYQSEYEKVVSSQYVSYLETVMSFTGGAHPNTVTISRVFTQPESKKVTALTDIYNESIYSALSEYTRKNLPAQLKKDGITVSDIKGMFDDGTSADKNNWNTFYFKENSLAVIFGQYQIGPYVIGINEFEIPLSSLSKYKK